MNKIIWLCLFLIISCSRLPQKKMIPPTEKKNAVQTTKLEKKEHKSKVIGNTSVMNFVEAKRLIIPIQNKHPYTIYCRCHYEGKEIDLKSCGYIPRNDDSRAHRLEWEHVVPAENFGRSFVEWRSGVGCPERGRECARTNQNFNFMEGDLYNLWPEVGELNGLRSNYNMAELEGDGQFGECKAKVEDRKFEPMDFAKGTVARVYMYMDAAYPQADIISEKNRKLFEAWDKMYPVDAWECERTRRIFEIQGNHNEIVESRCKAAGL